MVLKVAIAGMAQSAEDAPWGDASFQKWGLPWHNGYADRYDRLFEMHDIRLLQSGHSRRIDGYLESLANQQAPVYMQECYMDGIVRYPFEQVEASIGAHYFNSSIAYAMALAIHENATEIEIHGVDMVGDDEYGYQRPNMEYLIGVARGRGSKVLINKSSSLCRFANTGIRFYNHVPTYVKRYGWLG